MVANELKMLVEKEILFPGENIRNRFKKDFTEIHELNEEDDGLKNLNNNVYYLGDFFSLNSLMVL